MLIPLLDDIQPVISVQCCPLSQASRAQPGIHLRI
jgi:hypothetical protein